MSEDDDGWKWWDENQWIFDVIFISVILGILAIILLRIIF